MEEGEEDGGRNGDSKIGQGNDISLPVTEQINAVSNTSIEPVVVATVITADVSQEDPTDKTPATRNETVPETSIEQCRERITDAELPASPSTGSQPIPTDVENGPHLQESGNANSLNQGNNQVIGNEAVGVNGEVKTIAAVDPDKQRNNNRHPDQGGSVGTDGEGQREEENKTKNNADNKSKVDGEDPLSTDNNKFIGKTAGPQNVTDSVTGSSNVAAPNAKPIPGTLLSLAQDVSQEDPTDKIPATRNETVPENSVEQCRERIIDAELPPAPSTCSQPIPTDVENGPHLQESRNANSLNQGNNQVIGNEAEGVNGEVKTIAAVGLDKQRNNNRHPDQGGSVGTDGEGQREEENKTKNNADNKSKVDGEDPLSTDNNKFIGKTAGLQNVTDSVTGSSNFAAPNAKPIPGTLLSLAQGAGVNPLADDAVESEDCFDKTDDEEGVRKDEENVAENATPKKTKKKKKKGKKKKKNKKIKSEQPTAGQDNTVKQTTGITVVFHALLSPKWKKKSPISIRGGTALFSNWKKNVLTMKTERTNDNQYDSLHGKIFIPMSLVGDKIPYKYVVGKGKGKKVDWEELVEFPPADGYVNRCLFIPNSIAENGIWHQYDGFVHPELSWRSSLVNWLFGDGLNREYVVKEFFPKWNGFFADIENDDYTAVTAAKQLNFLLSSVSRVWISVGNNPPNQCVPTGSLNIPKVLVDVLTPKVYVNLDILSKNSVDAKVVVDAIVSSVVIAISFHRYNVLPQLSNEFLVILLRSLRIPPNTEICNKLMKEIFQLDKQVSSKLAESLYHLCNHAINQLPVVKDWLYVLPLLNFVRGQSQPFAAGKSGKDIRSSEWKWWGLEDIKVEEFLRNISYRSPTSDGIIDMFSNLEQLFPMDFLLKRTFLLFCPIDTFGQLFKTRHFSAIEMCNTMRRMLPEFVAYSDLFVDSLTSFFSAIKDDLIQSNSTTTEESIQEDEDLMETFLTLLAMLLNRIKLHQTDVICHIIEGFSALIGRHKIGENFRTSTDTYSKKLLQSANHVEHFLNRTLPYNMNLHESTLIDELLAWSNLLSINMKDRELDKLWNDFFLSRLKQRVKKVKHDDVIRVFCMVGDQELHSDVTEYLSNAAFGAIDEIMKRGGGMAEGDFNHLSKAAVERGGGEVAKLLNFMLEQGWPRCDGGEVNDEQLIIHLLTWPNWKGFLQYFGKISDDKINLPTSGQMMISKAESRLEHLVNSVQDRSIAVGTLELLAKYSKQFLVLGQIIQKSREASSNIYQRIPINDAFNHCREELVAFLEEKKILKSFLDFCEHFKAVHLDFNELREKAAENCKCRSIQELCVHTSEGIEVTFFNLDHSLKSMIRGVDRIQNSQLFCMKWEEAWKNLEESHLPLDKIPNSVWLPVCEDVQNERKEFLSGKMKMKQVEKYLKLMKGDPDNLKKEFRLVMTIYQGNEVIPDAEIGILNSRVEQVKDYQRLLDAHKAAWIIMRFKEEMELKGNFMEVEEISQMMAATFRNQSLDSVSKELVEAGEKLKKVTKLGAECLMAFIECQPLVMWLKEKMKEQELKVFVDLAMISAGESDVEIDRISSMHTSCLGFGPLIYKLEADDGFEELMDHCKTVWESVETNPTLPKKLKETNAILHWLKEIEESMHGTVDFTTMKQVDAINCSGIYFVGKPEMIQDAIGQNIGITLEDTLYLVLPKDKVNNREQKIYSLEEVKDVQSKLMLIAGKAANVKEKVEHFVEVFEGVRRVDGLYANLCEAGEINYLAWRRDFQNTTTGNEREELLCEINQLCLRMEEDLKKWKEKMENSRNKCYSLNLFSMKQVLKLRNELALACKSQIGVDELSLQVYTLLESVRSDLDPFVLALNLETVFPKCSCYLADGEISQEKFFRQDDSDDDDEDGELDMHELTSSESSLPTMKLRRSSKENFDDAKEVLTDRGCSDEVIIASLAACGRGAVADEMIAWAISNEDDDETVEIYYQEARDDDGLSDLLNEFFESESDDYDSRTDYNQNCEVIANDEGERGSDEHNFDVFESLARNDNQDYLTLEALAILLDSLSNGETGSRQRKFPSNFKKDEPNLIMVPKGDVFAAVLSLFMGDGDRPLPTDAEVIICDEKTTAEEIELLWRRAVVNNSGLLFCLANADLLDYDVSQQAVLALDKITQGKQDYRITVICNTENENRAHIVAALDHYRRHFTAITSVEGIRSYLTKQMSVHSAQETFNEDTDIPWEPAGMVDKDCLPVRVLQSSRSGVGKSLLVQRLTRKLEDLENNKRLKREIMPILCPTIPVHGMAANSDKVTKALLKHAIKRNIPVSQIYHLDISQTVTKGLDTLLFNLLVLQCIKDSNGNVWRRKCSDLYVVEITTDESFSYLVTDKIPTNENHHQRTRRKRAMAKYSFLKFLPIIHCLSPRETLDNLAQNREGDTGFDIEIYRSDEYQRSFQYLTKFDSGRSMDNFSFKKRRCAPFKDAAEALKIIIKYCGIRDPSWAELRHFVNFLNSQLSDFEQSIFCDPALVGDILHGFRSFIVRFLIQMSRDFATRSLYDLLNTADDEDELSPFQIRRRWEQSPHPYVFFNHDRNSMTFLGFLLSKNGDLLNPANNETLENRLMSPILRQQLKLQGVNFDKNYETWDRETRITNLCRVMGIRNYSQDPDSTYELTTDNVEKILAIHMRFRCGIPVIIMGETGCGKTRLIRFMCELQAGPEGPKNMLLMKVHGGTTYKDIEEKVTEAEELARQNTEKNIDTVLFFDEANTTDAIDLIKEIMVDKRLNGFPLQSNLYRLHFIAACNPYRKHTKEMIHKLESAGLGYHVTADETEDKLGSIPLRQLVYRVHPLPESMRPLVWDFGQLTEHTEELYTRQIVRRFVNLSSTIKVDPVSLASLGSLTVDDEVDRESLASSGASTDDEDDPVSASPGPSTDDEDDPVSASPGPSTDDEIDAVSLVSPKSSTDDEVSLVSLASPGPSIVYKSSNRTEDGQFIYCNRQEESCIVEVLVASQKYMRQQKNECSFVSLRDVERAMDVITWFYANSELISRVVGCVSSEDQEESSSEDSDDEIVLKAKDEKDEPLSRIVRALVLGIGVCYYARLYERETYCKKILKRFRGRCSIPGGASRMVDEISRCQQAFLDDVELAENIAKNAALSENVFMMAICTELRIPLFVVGKPGSSKSLAKDVISTNMQGNSSNSRLFKNLKQIIHMQSYQCSPLSTPDGIVSTFRQCAKLQKDKDLDKFVSVVVLDEIGLAEDSPLMPLKTLHPLLQDGTATEEEDSETSVEHCRVGFIGLSNWALDPAKMNRGIMLSRGVPSEEELIDSARGICSSNKQVKKRIDGKIRRLAKGYEKLYDEQRYSETLQRAKKEEFFGLRDFYSLVKMVCALAAEEKNNRVGTIELEKTIKRNFSGLDDFDPMKFFCSSNDSLENCIENPSPQCHPVSLIKQSLQRKSTQGESRYLLILTENYAALSILQQQVLEEVDRDPVVIFGSSFPKDQQYTQICRNINRIKICMETGRSVILLNLESLYESLYDALNQYYMYLSGQKYVDLGLGNHRVKCRVDDDFKLIVIAEKEVVYQRFPIPLINRLEKHFLVMSTGLMPNQCRVVEKLEDWVKMFSNAEKEDFEDRSAFQPGDSFVGYHSDTAAAVVMQLSENPDRYNDEQILVASQQMILQCACPDAVARLPLTALKSHAEDIWSLYFDTQKHNSLLEYLSFVLSEKDEHENSEGVLVQVTTHSRLLSQSNAKNIASTIQICSRCISLQEFHTEQQFRKTIQNFCVQLGGQEGLLIIQCDNGEANSNLVACCRYLVVDIRRQAVEEFGSGVRPIHIVFIVHLPKILGGCQNFVGFQGGKWRSVHIDELRQSNEQLPRFDHLVDRSISDLLQPLSTREHVVDSQAMDVDTPKEEESSFLSNAQSDQNINPNFILRNCLQKAAARVYCDSVHVNRATRRIEILLDLLPDDSSERKDGYDCPNPIVIRVHQLLKERDDKCWQDQKLWLQNEAFSQGHLQETGTFRKALWEKLSSVVSPILSEVIAFADCNQNLDLARGEDPWKEKLWNAMLSNEQVTPLAYESFVSPVSNLIRERACVKATGARHNFCGRFPFSWVIKDFVNNLLIQVTEASPTKAAVIRSLRGVVGSSPLGVVFKQFIDEEEVKESAMMDYLHDFLHMVYKPTVANEIELVEDALISAAKSVYRISNPNEEFSLDVSLIHFAHSLIQPRLACFADLVQAFPDVVKKLAQHRSRLNIDEMNLDIVALEFYISELEPTKQQLQHYEHKMTWYNQAQTVKPTMQVMTGLVENLHQEHQEDSQSNDLFLTIGDESIRIMNQCRFGCVRLGVVRLFIEHTCPSGLLTHQADVVDALRLWKALGETPDFSSVETVTVIERFLKECTEEINKRHFKRALERYNSFRERCKAFFMELVAVYCFGDESRQLPKPALVKKFIGYVIKEDNKTEEFTPFDGQGIDTTPVVRSFILQQLLTHKGNIEEVRGHLEDYLKRAGGLAENRDHMIEVGVLCVQCIEDVETTKLLKCKDAGKNVEICMASKMLERSLQVISIDMRMPPNIISITSLQTVADTRAALVVLSTYLGENYTKNCETLEGLPKLVDVARNLCSGTNRSYIQLFLLKQLVRKYGIGIVKERCQNVELQWIFPPKNQQLDNTPDGFIVHHEDYHKIREALSTAILTCSIEELNQVLQNLRKTPARDCYVLLSLFREIATSYATEDGQEISDEAMEMISEFMVDTNYLSNGLKPFADLILTNSHYENVDMLRVASGRSGNQRGLGEVLIHLRIVLECFPQLFLLQPLRNLAVNPSNMRDAFLPTMPHDYGVEAMQVENIGRWYECPNGHRYVITECGEPNQNFVCPDCQAPIGGSGQLAEMNRDASSEDHSTTGHIIGPAQWQPQSLPYERDLTPIALGVLRFLTHAALLLGADQNIEDINLIIKPHVANGIEFLQAHLQHDIRCLARCTGNNEDEAMLIVHSILAGIVNQGLHQPQGIFDATLMTTESRAAWENEFVSSYLNPILSNLFEHVQDCVARVVRDERLGNDPLIRQIYELDLPNYDVMDSLDVTCPALWRYRTSVSVEHLKVKFQEYVESSSGSSRCEILREFLKKDHLLRALQFLPDILKFQRLLSQKFHRRMDRSEAEKFYLGEFLKRASQMRKQFKTLVNSFQMAWKLVRPFLSENGRLSISVDLCALEISNSTPISMFLPTNSGLGKCALALTGFLVSLHNDFIGHCKSLLEDEMSTSSVPLNNITKSHLVAYDPEKDLLPLILAHCNYSLKVGEGTAVEYNWKALERQLVDRFIRGRHQLTTAIELFVFSKDICDGDVFATLKQKIHQIELRRPVQDQIIDELDQLTDICDTLKTLQVAIGFLASAGGLPDMLIGEYLHTALKIAEKDGLKSAKAQQVCQLRHIVSLWRLMSFQRAKILIRNKQDPFDDISQKCKTQLSNTQTFNLSRGLQKLNVDLFVLELLEVILLYLKHVSEEQLHWPLSNYLEVILEEKHIEEFADISQYLPQDILLEHTVETWKIACQKSEDYH